MITIEKDGISLNHTRFLFPGGEIGVKLDVSNHKYLWKEARVQTVVARLKSSDDIMELVMVADALRRFDKTPINLIMPYVPYGRQDRVCVPGESFSLKAFAAIINSLEFQSVLTFDPHSDVTMAVINRLSVINQVGIFGAFDELNAHILNNAYIFVSADAGANKKTHELAAFYGHPFFLRADKMRDLSTGKIKEIVVINDAVDVKGHNVMIADDLCDAGGTFIGLAAALKAKGAAKVDLYVTHGLFTKGTKPLYEGGIDNIWTTDSYHDVWPAGISDSVKTLKINKLL